MPFIDNLFQRLHRRVNVGFDERMRLTLEFDLIQAFQLIDQHCIEQYARQLTAASRHGLLG